VAGNIKGLTVEIGAETKGLEAALKDVGKRTADVNRELGQVERALKFDPSNTVLLGQKQALLADKVEATKEKLEALRQAQARVDSMFASGEIDDGQYRAFQRDIVTTENKLQTFEGQLREVETQQKQTATSAKNMGDDVDKAGDKAKSSEGKFKASFSNIAKAAGAAALAVGAAAIAIGAKAIENADELQRLSDATGMSAERLGELQYIGNNLGVELETVAGAQAKLTKSMNAAREGTGTQAEAFAALGISVVDANGNLRDAKDVMGEAFSALNGVGNETERDALAMQIFGKGAQDLNPLITAGSDELARLSQEARDNGAVMSNEAVAGLDTFGDTLDNIKNSVLGSFGEAVAGLLPKIQPFIDMITGAEGAMGVGDFIPPEVNAQLLTLKTSIDEFSANTMPKISAWFDEFIGPTVDEIKTAFGDMAMEIIPTVTAIVDFVNENWPAIQRAIEPVMGAIRDLISGVMQIIAGIIRTVMAVIRGDWSAAWEGIKTVFNGVVDVFKSTTIGMLIQQAFEKVKEIGPWFEDMKTKVMDVINKLLDKLKKPIADIKNLLNEINPFTRHSPSLVDNVLAGVKQIGDAYGSLADMRIAGPSIAGVSAGAGQVAATLAGSSVTNVSSGGNVTIQNLTVDGSKMPTADFNGLIASIQMAKRMSGR